MKVIKAGGGKPQWRGEDRPLRVLDKPLSLWLEIEDGSRKGHLCLDLPAGWTTDGASIPKAFRWFAGHPFDEDMQLAFLWHDALYATHYESRAFADALYVACLAYEGVGYMRRKAQYYALRMGGGNAWRDESINEITAARKGIGYSEEWRGK